MRLGVGAAVVRGELVPGDVEIDGGVVTAVGLLGEANGRVAIPGLVDLQVNGYAGVDFLAASRADYERAHEALLEGGVTAYQPTFITAPESTLLEALAEVPASTQVIGAHVEGPFLSPERLGTHPREHRRDPDLALLQRLLDAGPVTQYSLAPELPGADAVIAQCLERGIVVAAAHTNATAGEAHRAFDLGVSTVVHLFNAMRPFRSRDPGIAGVALTRPDVTVQLIVDGHHLSEETVRLIWAAAGGRAALVTDAMAGAGAGSQNGSYQLGDVSVAVSNGVPVRDDGVFAGTVLTMIEAVRNLHALGVPLAEAVRAATEVPARIVRRPDLGVLEPGARADVVVLDDRLEIAQVVVGGDALVVA
jgi:N-acetylglucosamine-6-phosphate deacetylase